MTATLEADLLTPRMLEIPGVIIRRYAAAGRREGLDHDELLSVANLAFAKALASWDPDRAPEGGGGLGPYLVQRVNWRVRNEVWLRADRKTKRDQQRRTLSLDALAESLLASRDASPLVEDRRRRYPDPVAAAASADGLAYLLELASQCGPQCLRAARLISRGLKQSEAARKMGVSREWVGQLMKRLREEIERERRKKR